MLIRLLTVIVILLIPKPLKALPFAQGRGSAGYAYLEGDQASSTSMISGAGRFGYAFDNSKFSIAFDVTAYRLHDSSSLTTNNDGNSLLLVFGHNWESLALWLGGGAGEIRSFDRESDKSRPYRYYVTDAQCGFTYDFYQSDSARVELGMTLGQLTPDPEWQARYGLKSVKSLQFDIGFKLLNW